ncbi:MAG: Panacea domain-containing protein [Candidatus Thiodiazotropha lotti]|nr:SocA family protein [Candidatus Thiodiazotropha lotti]MCG8004627.1 SocA family protein [Candidatus Thiodiazotropha lotti]MCG8006644.1 SocA family protein [Candidatus Thiodiazotropha lotti]MCW4188254.1 Panacea domain-containing protein [Candidatus Thiodiazotropha lotti]MCW4194226.1 Panacea domain-containing protein [Candidatus Thiodiazotropha lotti]
MLIRREREKLINTVIYFVRNTNYCGKVKLFKLLYFLDFEHFKFAGRSVTGLEYFAWKMGPVPTELDEEIDAPEPDMAESLEFSMIPIRGGSQTMLQILTKKEFDPTHFSKREIHLMEDLVGKYKDKMADDMIEATHLENLPWDQVYNKQGNVRQLIPYELAIRSQEEDLMSSVAKDHSEVVSSLS